MGPAAIFTSMMGEKIFCAKLFVRKPLFASEQIEIFGIVRKRSLEIRNYSRMNTIIFLYKGTLQRDGTDLNFYDVIAGTAAMILRTYG